jgi:isocitrate/isopropylmalate dehydrogenase
MKLNIALLPGDGIGPEIIEQGMKAVKAICEKFGHELTYEKALVGACAIDAYGNPYPDSTHELCMKSDAVYFGAIGSPKYDNDPSAKVRPEQGLLAMRKKLGLFANIRPVSTFESLFINLRSERSWSKELTSCVFASLQEVCISVALKAEAKTVTQPTTLAYILVRR